MNKDNLSIERPLKSAFYIRVSTDDQAERFGPDLQIEALNNLVKSKGTLRSGENVILLPQKEHIYREDISGTVLLDERPEFARLKEDILHSPNGERPFDIVLVYKIDRFARKLKILLDVLDFFEKYDIKFISANESIDTSTPFGKAILGIIGVIAELEIETIKQRTHAGKEEAQRQGRYPGPPPYGYTKDDKGRLSLFKEEAPIVVDIFNMFANLKYNPQKIANTLTSNNIISPGVSRIVTGKVRGTIKKKNDPTFWNADRIRKMLNDEVYIGNFFYNKTKNKKTLPHEEWKLSEYHHEPLVDVVTFEKAKIIFGSLKSNKPDNLNKNEHLYILSSLIKCASCYEEERDSYDGMVAWYGDRKETEKGSGIFRYYYKCRRKNKTKTSLSCKSTPISAEHVEEYIKQFVKELIKNPVAVFNHQKQLQSTKLELKKLRDRRKDIQDLLDGETNRKKNNIRLFELGHIKENELKERIADIESKHILYTKELKEIDVQISQNTLSVGYIQSLELFNERYQKKINTSLTNDEWYEIIHMLIDQIIVYSRPLAETEKLPGKKREGQEVIEKIHIKLRLPQDFLRELKEKAEKEMDLEAQDVSKEFEVKNSSW